MHFALSQGENGQKKPSDFENSIIRHIYVLLGIYYNIFIYHKI